MPSIVLPPNIVLNSIGQQGMGGHLGRNVLITGSLQALGCMVPMATFKGHISFTNQ
jgi:hypothetical protein